MVPRWSAAPPISWTSKWRWPMVRRAASRVVANASGSRSSRGSPSSMRCRNSTVLWASSSSERSSISGSHVLTSWASCSSSLRRRPSPMLLNLSMMGKTDPFRVGEPRFYRRLASDPDANRLSQPGDRDEGSRDQHREPHPERSVAGRFEDDPAGQPRSRGGEADQEIGEAEGSGTLVRRRDVADHRGGSEERRRPSEPDRDQPDPDHDGVRLGRGQKGAGDARDASGEEGGAAARTVHPAADEG